VLAKALHRSGVSFALLHIPALLDIHRVKRRYMSSFSQAQGSNHADKDTRFDPYDQNVKTEHSSKVRGVE
jgi:hypothetical protein